MAQQPESFVVLQWPRDLPTAPMMRYPFEFTTRQEAEEFRKVAEAKHPDLEFAVQQLNQN